MMTLISWALLTSTVAMQPADLRIENNDFALWQGNNPVGWTVGVGATNGSGPESTIARLDGSGGLVLAGDASTKVWRVVSQRILVQPGTTIRLNIEARAVGLRREGNQFDNCYVGLLYKDADGNLVGRPQVVPIANPAMRRQVLTATIPKGTRRTEVTAFLSKTGRLEVRGISAERVDPRSSYEMFAGEISRNYSYLAHSGVDWPSLVEANRESAERASNDPEAFAAVIRPMLERFEDLHVSIRLPNGEVLPTYLSLYRPNGTPRGVMSRLSRVQSAGRVGFVGRTRPDGFGYLAVTSLVGSNADFAGLEEALRSVLDAPGLIVDLRINGGGDERRAAAIAGILTRERLVYAQSQVRSGPSPTDFTPPRDRTLPPRSDLQYDGPVVCLFGPGTVSSAEGFALMMNSLPNVTTIGLPTRGASGNPAPVILPNGVTVSFSRWVALNRNGEPIEDRGVQPDLLIDSTEDGDPTFHEAILTLRDRRAER